MKISVKNFKGNMLFVFLILVLTTLHFHQKNLLGYTGDEPRFVYYAYSIVKGKMLKVSNEQFMEGSWCQVLSVPQAHETS